MMFRKIVSITFALAVLSLFSSCSGSLGYGVMLWGDEEHGISDGEIVKVYFRSNISHTYNISRTDDSEKFEIPLWKITEPESKSAASRQVKRFEEFKGTFARVKQNRLPIRSAPDNTKENAVYFLRENEVIRVLYRGDGVSVVNGRGDMAGEWLRVLTSSGTIGWCFSNKLELYKGDIAGLPVSENNIAAAENGEDLVLNSALQQKWYPDYYASMIRNNRIDIRRIDSSYGFNFGSQNERPAASAVTDSETHTWAYESIEKNADGDYELKGADSKVSFSLKKEGSLVLTYSEKGKPKKLTFVSIDRDIDELIEKEKLRRAAEIEGIKASGPVFVSSNYGAIVFENDGKIKWNSYSKLVPEIIGKNAGSSATVSIEYFISNQLKSAYDGVLTVRFSGINKGINFLYKLTDNGLRLEDAARAPVRDGTVTGRSSSPLIMFFEKR